MGHEVTIGGQRLGSGKRMQAYLHNYERSTHDLGYIWRSTMAAGTLVPFLCEVALPGDTFDIELNVDILTHPTIGPLFGSYKVQLDVFQIPIRLYNASLHMNMLGIGMDMSEVKFPQVFIDAPGFDTVLPPDNQQINPSCIWNYLGIRGLGANATGVNINTKRKFNAIPFLAYWDIYKNYYANKQEEIGAVIHKSTAAFTPLATSAILKNVSTADIVLQLGPTPPVATYQATVMYDNSYVEVAVSNLGTGVLDPSAIYFGVQYGSSVVRRKWSELFTQCDVYEDTGTVVISAPVNDYTIRYETKWGYIQYEAQSGAEAPTDTEPAIVTFPLKNIDDMRIQILQFPSANGEFIIDRLAQAPYGLPFEATGANFAQKYSQEGLGLKTYQSDLFNNWISTEWIDGPEGISAITAIDTSGGSFTIDELNMSKKVYDMLNRIAISGGSYDDWLDAVYTHERTRSAENPMYLGGLIANLVFQEVVSNSRSLDQPLGTLAGRGTMGQKRKGGQVTAKIDEPSYIMGIVSITPNIDYSQGNKWDTNLKTMNDLHKPALDEIGFQDLITDQMAFWDTQLDIDGVPTFKSAGKQPAWINYMTNVNKVYGNFADANQQMFMVLNRRYDALYGGTPRIKDLTTYIDPTKFNHIFADTRLDAQNFWTQIGCEVTARRKMSAKVMPNL